MIFVPPSTFFKVFQDQSYLLTHWKLKSCCSTCTFRYCFFISLNKFFWVLRYSNICVSPPSSPAFSDSKWKLKHGTVMISLYGSLKSANAFIHHLKIYHRSGLSERKISEHIWNSFRPLEIVFLILLSNYGFQRIFDHALSNTCIHKTVSYLVWLVDAIYQIKKGITARLCYSLFASFVHEKFTHIIFYQFAKYSTICFSIFVVIF